MVLLVALLVINRPGPLSENTESGDRRHSKETTETSSTVTAGQRAEITTDGLNLRSAPDANEEAIIGTLRKGLVVEVLEKQPGWLKIKLDDGRIGYVAFQEQYIKFLDE